MIVNSLQKTDNTIKIAMVGKYVTLADSYVSVNEALKHASASIGRSVNIDWIDSETFNGNLEQLDNFDGILVPGGFGTRGSEGIIDTATYALEKNIPYLGICFGFQLAAIAFGRKMCNLENANSTEIIPDIKNPIIDLLPEQKQETDMGGSLRLGANEIKINQDLKKDFIDAKEETLKINHFINEQKKQLKLLHEEGLEIDQEMLNFEKNKNQLQVEFIDKQKKLIDKNEEEIKKLKILNQEYQEKISSSEEFIGNLKIKEENFKNLNQKYIEKIAKLEEIITNFKTKEEEIKFYQNDNLRLSNELFEVSKKLEDHKVRMNEFENNKSQIQEQIYNLNKIISKNNIVKNHFDLFSQNKDVQNISKITVKEKPDIELTTNHENVEEKI